MIRRLRESTLFPYTTLFRSGRRLRSHFELLRSRRGRRGLRALRRLSSEVKGVRGEWPDRKSTRLNSSHVAISYAVFCLKKKKVYITRHFHYREINLRYRNHH